MDIQHLRYFVQVVENESYTRAAEKLMVTQPMLSRVIRQLEEELGVTLIQRSSKYFGVTDAGKLFYEEAQALLQRHEDLYRSMDDLKQARSGQVALSTPGVLLDIYFAPLLLQFHQKYPNIKIDIIEEGSTLTARSVLSGQAELGLVMLPVKGASRLVTHIVTTSVCQLLVNRRHPFARRKSVHISELQHERVITFSNTATLHDAFILRCEAAGFSPNIVYKTLMPNFTFEMVSLGLGTAVLPLPVIQRYIKEDQVRVPLDPLFVWEIAVIRKKDCYQSFAARHLLAFIREYFLQLERDRDRMRDTMGE